MKTSLSGGRGRGHLFSSLKKGVKSISQTRGRGILVPVLYASTEAGLEAGNFRPRPRLGLVLGGYVSMSRPTAWARQRQGIYSGLSL